MWSTRKTNMRRSRHRKRRNSLLSERETETERQAVLLSTVRPFVVGQDLTQIQDRKPEKETDTFPAAKKPLNRYTRIPLSWELNKPNQMKRQPVHARGIQFQWYCAPPCTGTSMSHRNNIVDTQRKTLPLLRDPIVSFLWHEIQQTRRFESLSNGGVFNEHKGYCWAWTAGSHVEDSKLSS